MSKICLSTRAEKILKRMNIDTVDKFLEIPKEDFEKQRGVGKKTIDELMELKKSILDGQIDFDERYDEESNSLYDEQNEISLPLEMVQQLSKHNIKELNLSNRSKNCLRRAGVENMAQLMELSEDQLRGIYSMGEKSVEEIKDFRAKWLKDNIIIVDQKEDINFDNEKEYFYNELSLLLKNIIPFSSKTLYKLCNEIGIDTQLENIGYENLSEKELFYLIDRVDEIGKGIERYFLSFFSKEKEYIDEEEIAVAIEKDFNNDAFKMVLYYKFNNGGFIKKIGDYCVPKRKSLCEYLSELDNTVKNQMLCDRLAGMILQEIGDKNGITRERVRQITVKTAENIPLLKEDYYSSVFQYFRFDRDLFYSVFPKTDKRTFEYLSIRYKKGNHELNRNEVSEYNGLYSFALEDYLNYNEKVAWKKGLSRQKISWRVLITKAGTYINKETFAIEYNRFLYNNSLDHKRYSYNPYSINNLFRYSAHVVFNKDGEFRYYENDATKLWKFIDFSRYKDTVISSELIYKDYIELMDEYDIWNGYELYCLLKNTMNVGMNDSNYKEVEFRRIPVMIIGDGNEEAQIIRLVKELSPIKYLDFYEAYEERFGVKKESAIANLGRFIEKYHSNNEYLTDLPRLDLFEEQKIKDILEKKDIWSVEELEKIFEEYTATGIDALNNTTLYDLGYNFNVGYAYSRKYSHVTDCLKDVVFSKELIDLNDVDSNISRLSCFKSYVYSLRLSTDYIEVSPKVLASREFLEREYGLTEEMIRTIQKKTNRFYTEKYFNANSLWENIKDYTEIGMLRDNKWLCTSIMRQQEGVFAKSVGNVVILSLYKEELSLAKICSWIVDKEGKMTVEHLTKRINEIFGSGLDKYNIAFKIKEQGNEEELLTDGVEEYIDQLITISGDSEDDFFKEEFY